MVNNGKKYLNGKSRKYMQRGNDIKEKINREKETNQHPHNKYATIFSILSLIISISLGIATIHNANREYKYKLSPEIEYYTKFNYDSVQNNMYIKDLKIKIIHKNSLDKSYIVYPDYTVKRLNINKDGVVQEEENEFSSKYDLSTDYAEYQYRFFLFKKLNGDFDLTLIYLKQPKKAFDNEREFTFLGMDDIDAWGFTNREESKEFEGEKILAKKYLEALKTSREFLNN